MSTLVILVALLLGSFAALTLVNRVWWRGRLEASRRGCFALAVVFLFTGMGHFARTQAMAEMLPSWIPQRPWIVYGTGVLELVGALGLLTPRWSRAAGRCLLLFLVLVFPANIHAALHRVDMGGHSMGPKYLLARAPLQLLLVGWTYWFAVRRSGPRDLRA